MIYRLDMDVEIQNLIRHFSPSLKQNLKEAFRSIARNPYSGKPLQDELKGMYSYRIRSFRIIYGFDAKHKIVHVITVGPRKTVYEDLEKNILKSKT